MVRSRSRSADHTEQDPMIAICGAVGRADRLKRTHQSMDAVAALSPFTEYTGEVNRPDNVQRPNIGDAADCACAGHFHAMGAREPGKASAVSDFKVCEGRVALGSRRTGPPSFRRRQAGLRSVGITGAVAR